MTWSQDKEDRMVELNEQIILLKKQIHGARAMGALLHARNQQLEALEREYYPLRAERAFYRVEGMERNGS